MKYVALFITIVLISGIFASMAGAEVREVHLSPSESAQMHPRIWGSTVVWEDYRNDPTGLYTGAGKGNPDIYAYNLTLRKEIPVCTAPGAQQNPDIWKNLVVWEDYRNGNADIYIYNLSDPHQNPNGTRLTYDSSAQVNPRIWGNWVVWIDYRNGLDGDVYAFDLSSVNWKDPSFGESEAKKAIIPICRNIYEQRDVAIWKDIVVWKDYRNDTGNGDRNIFGYNLETHKEFQITTEKHNQFQPAICNNTVVWVDMRDGVSTIYGKKLGTSEEFIINPDGKPQTYPSIYGNTVTWLENRDGVRQVMYANIGGSASSVEGNHSMNTPDISSAGIVWADGREMRDINGREVPVWNVYFLRPLSGNRAPIISNIDVILPDDGVEKGKPANITVRAHIYDPDGDNFTATVSCCNESAIMYDDGKHGDCQAGDGIYGAILNITPSGHRLDITISAVDEYGAVSTSSKSVSMTSAEQAMMTLMGIGAVFLVIVVIFFGIYMVRTRGSARETERIRQEKESSENSGEETEDEEIEPPEPE